MRVVTWILLTLLSAMVSGQAQIAPAKTEDQRFRLEEATIEDVRRAIQTGQTTCHGLVQAYVERARAYNGVCTALVTRDGALIAPGRGATRAGSPVVFPSATVAVSTVLPDLDQYAATI